MDGEAGTRRRRFPGWVYDVGEEADTSFSLSNERTFLSGARTGLTLLAGGVALEALDLPVARGWRLAAALVLVLAGTATPALAWWSWGRAERAGRLQEPLPHPVLFVALVAGITVAGLLVLVGLALA